MGAPAWPKNFEKTSRKSFFPIFFATDGTAEVERVAENQMSPNDNESLGMGDLHHKMCDPEYVYIAHDWNPMGHMTTAGQVSLEPSHKS